MSTVSAARPRFWEVDAARGVALAMMVVYHLIFDLATFGGYPLNPTSGFWDYFADVTASLFILLAGVSLTISFSAARSLGVPQEGLFPKYLKRGLRIFSWGLFLTLVTWVLFPRGAIVFGILHLIGASIPLAYPFLRFRWLNLLIGVLVVVAGLYLLNVFVDFPWLLWLGVQPYGAQGLDYRPLFPWFGFILLGLFAGKVIYPDGKRRFRLPELGNLPGISQLSFLGRHSLFIYLIHQPVLIAVLITLGIISLDSLLGSR